MTQQTNLLIKEHDKWIELTLNRPDSFNALSKDMLNELQHAMHDIALRDDLSCVVINAKGKAFCAGHDLKEIRANVDDAFYSKLFQQCSQFMQSIVDLPIPVVAQVQGIATAAGCQLVASCDLAIASDTARFAVSGINLGLFCSTPAVALSRNIAPKHAMEMLLTGEFINAHEAQQKGLINRISQAEELPAATLALVETICNKLPVAVKTGKAMFYPQSQKSLAEAYEYASNYMVCNLMADETQAAIAAFTEKKNPQS
ncbi:MAG: enoyl-CoA hydratase [Gammaproteobacteria bacterium]|jgi:enoyl-CoA hydratase/carnithine racemase|nr:enoyl-CoA hydratase [Gammaproteobacteria bacterium]MCP4880358.1 enoyl-CoA hydratase [Gammaproteobacteria bacterium]MDP6165800.1 enoyl-CoA hydratase [Gammaproteobacteria bacterium]